jgi:hypothetical protein
MNRIGHDWYQQFTVQREIERKWRDEHGTWRREIVGREEVIVGVTLNIRETQNLAQKAAANRTGRSRTGPLVAKVVSRKKLA